MDISKTVEEIFEENDWDSDVIVFRDYDYADAIIGISHDNRAVYSYNRMVEWLMAKENMTETEAVDWIEYNTMNALNGDGYPIVIFDRCNISSPN